QIPSVGRFIYIEHFLAERSQGRNVNPESPITAVAARAATAKSAWRAVPRPDAGQVMFVVSLVRILRIGCRNSALPALPHEDSRNGESSTNEQSCLNPIRLLRTHGFTAAPAGAGAPPRGASPGPPPATPMMGSPFSFSSVRIAPTGVPAREGAIVFVTFVTYASAVLERFLPHTN